MPNTSRVVHVFLVACWFSLGLYTLAARAAPQPPAAPHVPTALAARPYLRTVLPPDALAYARIANPWGLLGMPKGNMLSEALASEGIQAAMSTLQEAVVHQLLGPLQTQLGPLPGVLLDQVRAPLELAVLRPAGRLFFLATQNPTPAALTQRLQSLQPRTDAPMLPLEAEVDTSGQGFFVWLDTRAIFTLAESLMPPEELLAWQRLGGHTIQQIAFGMGVSASKGRLKLVLEMPRVGVRTLLPAVEAPLAFDAAGALEGLVMLGLPNASDWQQAEAFVKTHMPDLDEQLQPFKEGVLAVTGWRFDDWLNLFGPELVYVADAAGHYSVLRLRDPEKFATLLEVLQHKYGFRYEQRTLHGQTYAHLIFPDFEDLMAQAYPGARVTANPMERLWWRLFSVVPGHLYWKLDGQYLIVAPIPQVLIDRDRIAAKTPIKSWLKDTQKLPGDDALLLASARVEGIPRLIYAAYLQVLQSLSDLAGQPLDLFTLPSAMQVKLPQHGSYGVKLTSSVHRLALEATYESNPLEAFFVRGGVQTLAMVGLLATITVPNLLEYRRHAAIGQQLSQVAAFKTMMAEFYVAQGRFPTANEIADAFAALEAAPIAAQIEIEPDTGVIVLYVKQEKLGEHNRVYFRPTPQGRTVQWSCRADFEVKYTLQECR